MDSDSEKVMVSRELNTDFCVLAVEPAPLKVGEYDIFAFETKAREIINEQFSPFVSESVKCRNQLQEFSKLVKKFSDRISQLEQACYVKSGGRSEKRTLFDDLTDKITRVQLDQKLLRQEVST